ncbi:MAG: CPBP family intramembrane glutamic endopeptidase [Dehalococcoidia bacterium]
MASEERFQPPESPEVVLSQTEQRDHTPWGTADIAKAIGFVVLGAVAILIPAVIAIALLDRPDSEAETLISLAPSLALEGLLVLVVVRFTVGKYRCSWSDLGFRPVERGGFWLPPLLVIGAWTIVVGYFALVDVVGAGALADQSQFPDEAFKSPVVIPLVGVLAIIAAPLAEETFFRGFVFRGMRNRWGLVGAAFASGLLFGVAHFLPILYIPFTLIGMLFAFGYVYSRSLWVPISAHLLFNSVSFIASVAVGTD